MQTTGIETHHEGMILQPSNPFARPETLDAALPPPLVDLSSPRQEPVKNDPATLARLQEPDESQTEATSAGYEEDDETDASISATTTSTSSSADQVPSLGQHLATQMSEDLNEKTSWADEISPSKSVPKLKTKHIPHDKSPPLKSPIDNKAPTPRKWSKPEYPSPSSGLTSESREPSCADLSVKDSVTRDKQHRRRSSCGKQGDGKQAIKPARLIGEAARREIPSRPRAATPEAQTMRPRSGSYYADEVGPSSSSPDVSTPLQRLSLDLPTEIVAEGTMAQSSPAIAFFTASGAASPTSAMAPTMPMRPPPPTPSPPSPPPFAGTSQEPAFSGRLDSIETLLKNYFSYSASQFQILNPNAHTKAIQFAPDNVKKLELLGIGGSSACIWKVKVDHMICAMKELILEKFVKNYDPVPEYHMNEEVKTLKSNPSHPNVIPLLHVDQTDSYIRVFVPLYAGTLESAILSSRLSEKRMSARRITQIMTLILQGLQALHANKVVHRDIKPGNILLTTVKGKLEELVIADFDMSKRVVSTGQLQHTVSNCFTPLYTAPELTKGGDFSGKADIWSAGLILFELLHLQLPYIGMHHGQMLNEISAGRRPEPPKDAKLNQDYAKLEVLFKNMTKGSYRQRPSAKEALEFLAKPLSLWTQPFDGGGRTGLTVTQAIFNFRLYQSVANLFDADSYFVRSTADGADWDLWQKTSGRTNCNFCMVSFTASSTYYLVQAHIFNETVQSRYTTDGVNWRDWKQIQSSTSKAPVSLYAFRQKLYLIHMRYDKKIALHVSKDADNWSTVKSISPQFTDLDPSKCIFSMIEFNSSLVITMIGSDNRIYYSYSNDGDVWSAWKSDSEGRTNKKIESVIFGNRIYQAIVGVDNIVYERSSPDLTSWTEWIPTAIRTSSAISMVVFDTKLIQAFHGMDYEIYLRYSVDGHNWTKWSSAGEKRKTATSITHIVFKGVLYQTITALDNFVLVRPITSNYSSLTRFKFDDTLALSYQRDEEYFNRLLENRVYAQLRSIGNEATDLATSLALNGSLTLLDLSGSNVGNDGLNIIANALRKHPTLKKLMLNDIQLIGAVEQLDTLIRYNSVLEELHLARNKLSDEGVRSVMLPLVSNTSIQFVDLSENGITSSGATVTAEILQSNTSLKSLKLSHNMLGSQGAVTIAKALESSYYLTSIDLYANRIGNEASKLIARMLQNNKILKSVVLGGQSYQRLEGIRPIAECLQYNQAITELNLSHCLLTSEGAIALAKTLGLNKTLTTLDISHNSIEDEGAIAIAGSLWNSPLKTLIVKKNDIGRVGAAAIAKSLQSRCAITTLVLDHNYIAQAVKEIANMLAATKTLTSLSMNSCRFGDQDVEDISKALHNNMSVQALYLADNSFGHAGVKAIAKMVDINSTLTKLSIWKNAIGLPGAQDLAKSLARYQIVSSLQIECAHSSPEEMASLANVLCQNGSLTDLALKGEIGMEGAKALASLIEENTRLVNLSILDGFVGNEGTIYLAEYMRKNTTLRTLSLRNNNIELAGARAIGELLQISSSLKRIDLVDNPIGYDGLNSIAMAMRRNTTLVSIQIDPAYTDQLDIAVAKSDFSLQYLAAKEKE